MQHKSLFGGDPLSYNLNNRDAKDIIMTTNSEPIQTSPTAIEKPNDPYQVAWITIAVGMLSELFLAFFLLPKDIKYAHGFQPGSLITPHMQSISMSLESIGLVVGIVVFVSIFGVNKLSRATESKNGSLAWPLIMAFTALYQISTALRIQDAVQKDQPVYGDVVAVLGLLRITGFVTIGAYLLFILWQAWAPRKQDKI
jgi:hypothetical protein